MKRFLISVVLLASAFACNTSDRVEGPTTPATKHDVAPDTVIELTEDQSDAADDLAHTVPTGAFASVTAFCNAQTKLVAPKILEANAAYKTDGFGEMNLKPSCAETPKALEGANVALGGSYDDVKAVTFETGYSTETYLLMHGHDGFTAIRSALLYDNHNDPGCGSIERPGVILEVHVEKGAVVVKTNAGRTWFNQKNEGGELTMSYVRACRPMAAGIACGTPEVVDAKVAIRLDETDPNGPVATRFFTTSYAVGTGVAIEPATRFDEEQL